MAKSDKSVPSLADLVPPESAGEITYSAEQLIGTPLYLNNYEVFETENNKGQTYPTARLYCTRPANGQQIIVSSGAKIVIEQLSRLSPDSPMPLYIVFRKMGTNTVLGK